MLIEANFSWFIIIRSIFLSLVVVAFGCYGLFSIPGALSRVTLVYAVLGVTSSIIFVAYGIHLLARMLSLLGDRAYLRIDSLGQGFYRPLVRRKTIAWDGPVDITYDNYWLLFDRPPVVGKLPVDKKGRSRLTLFSHSRVVYKGAATDYRNRGNVIPSD